MTEQIKKHRFQIGAEIGSGNGRNAMELLKRNSQLHLIVVAYYPNWPGKEGYCTTPKAKHMFMQRTRPFRTRMEIIWDTSHNAASEVEDESLDYIFIDADHTYDHVRQDIDDWVPKVKPGGLISGHDYGHEDLPSVTKAVDDAFGKEVKRSYNRVWYLWKPELLSPVS